MMRGSTTDGIALALSNTIMRFDVIVLSLLATASVAGVFAAAQTVIVIVYVLGSLLSSVLFPEMNRLAGRALEFQAYMRHWTRITLAFLVPGTLTAMIAGPPLVRMLFGAKFGDSGRLLAMMLPAAPFIVLNSLYLHRAFALHERRTYLGIYGGATLLAAILNPIAALWFGAVGVTVAVVIREMMIFTAFRMMDASRAVPKRNATFVSRISSAS
jgi:O-antigen/teichoic acid export membrane protein